MDQRDQTQQPRLMPTSQRSLELLRRAEAIRFGFDPDTAAWEEIDAAQRAYTQTLREEMDRRRGPSSG